MSQTQFQWVTDTTGHNGHYAQTVKNTLGELIDVKTGQVVIPINPDNNAKPK